MKTLYSILLYWAAGLFLLNCQNERLQSETPAPTGSGGGKSEIHLSVKKDFTDDVNFVFDDETLSALDKIAESERDNGYVPGLALSESTIREHAGDYAGATLAAYKELLWVYSLSDSNKNGISKKNVINTLRSVSDLYAEKDFNGKEIVFNAAQGAIAFTEERYSQAKEIFAKIKNKNENQYEPDSFLNWLILACELENSEKQSLRSAINAYTSIQKRYETFPLYWYFGARYLQGVSKIVYAERVIDLCKNGPVSLECRRIIADYIGLDIKNISCIKTKYEIETTITNIINNNDTQMIETLFDLIALDDNPYTLYAASMLRSLSSKREYNSFLLSAQSKAKGRLKERLAYITR